MAASTLEEMRRRFDADPASFVEYAEALIAAGQAARALEVCRAGLELHPERVDGHVTAGKALLRLGKPAEARAAFEAALKRSPRDAALHVAVGEALLERNLQRSAAQLFKRALALSPGNPRIQALLARAQGKGQREAVRPGGADAAAPQAQAERMPAGRAGRARLGAEGGAAVAHDGAPPSAEPTLAGYVPAATPAEPTPADRAAVPPPEPTWPDEAGAPAVRAGEAPPAEPTRADRATVPAPEPTWPDGTGAPIILAHDAPPPEPTRADRATVPPPEPTWPDELGAPATRAAEPPPAEPTRADRASAPSPTPAWPDEAGAPRGRAGEPPPAEPTRTDRAKRPSPEIVSSGEAGAASIPEALQAVPASDAAFDEDGVLRIPAFDARPRAAAGAAPPAETTRPEGFDLSGLEVTRVEGLGPGERRPDAPPPAPAAGGAAAPPPLRAGRKAEADDLLDLLPLPPQPPDEPPPAESSSVAEEAASAAAAYERELRERLAAEQARPPSFFRRHRLGISLGVLLAVAAGAGFAAWQYRRAATHAQDVARYTEQARNIVLRDTLAAYRASLAAIEEVLDREEDNASARALKAWVLATLAVRWADPDADPAEAAALIGPAEAKAEPELVLATRLLLASPDERKAVEEEILAVDPAKAGATVHSAAGSILLERGDLAAAIGRFNAALAAVPGHVPTLVRVAEHYRSRKEYSEALRYDRLALAVVEDHALALLGAAEAQLALATDAEPLQEALEAISKLQPEAVPAGDRDRLAILRARLLAGLERREEARQVLEPLHERARSDARLLPLLAGAWIEAGAPDRAAELFRVDAIDRKTPLAIREAWARSLLALERWRAVTVVPANAGDRNLHLYAGIAWRELGDRKKARAALRRTATRQAGKMPVDAVVHLALADLEDGAIAKARRNLERLGQGPRARTAGRWAWARLLAHEGRFDEAEAVLREAIARDRLAVEPRCALGRLLLLRGDASGAREFLDQALARNPFHAEARIALGEVALESGANDEARRHLEMVLEREAGNPVALGTLAILDARTGAIASAQRRLDRVARRDARHPSVSRARAELAWAKGDRQAALANLRLAARHAGKDPRPWIRLGDLLLEAGDAPKAEESYAAALGIDGRSVRALVGQARALAASGKVDQARQRLVARIDALGEKDAGARAILQDVLGTLQQSAKEAAARD